eukprot:138740-Chlamydomonas_euryale.AAC.5
MHGLTRHLHLQLADGASAHAVVGSDPGASLHHGRVFTFAAGLAAAATGAAAAAAAESAASPPISASRRWVDFAIRRRLPKLPSPLRRGHGTPRRTPAVPLYALGRLRTPGGPSREVFDGPCPPSLRSPLPRTGK